MNNSEYIDERGVKRLTPHSSKGYDPARRYVTRRPHDEYVSKGRPGGFRLAEHVSRNSCDDGRSRR
jgi:hypothetical protein